MLRPGDLSILQLDEPDPAHEDGWVSMELLHDISGIKT